jgi:anti-sigma-K factor RskA
MERNTRIEEELFPFYALDALTAEERDEVERYVAGNPEAEARLAELIATATDFGETATPIAPPPAIKAGLMARIEAESREAAPARPASAVAPRRVDSPKPRFDLRNFFFGRAMVFAALALLLGAFGLWRLWQQSNDLRTQLAALAARTGELQSELDSLRAANDALRAELAGRDELLAQYRQPGAVTIAIGDATGENPDAIGTLTLHPESGAATLSVANLPPLDETQTYQAWLIVEGTPVSAGTFTVDQAGAASHAIPGAAPGSFDAVGVSIEPAGGSEQPTPDQIIMLSGFPF